MLRRQSTMRVRRIHWSDKFWKGFLNLDIYRQPFTLLLPDGKNQYRTVAGSLLSIISVLLIFSYASYKYTKMVSLQNYKTHTMELDDFFGPTEGFTAGDGFLVAAGVINWDGKNEENPPIEIPPEIGSFSFQYKKFDPINGLYWERIESRYCT